MALALCSPLEVSQGLMHMQVVLIMSYAMLTSLHTQQRCHKQRQSSDQELCKDLR